MDAELDDSLYISEQRSSGEQTSEEDEQAQLIVFYPHRQPVPYRLHLGVNVVGRQSSFAQRDAMRLHQWSLDYDGINVHGIFLESSSISSAHAVIYLETMGECCFVKDLHSRNKTFVRRGGKHVAIEPEKQQLLHSGEALTFGALKCRVVCGSSTEAGVSGPFGSSPSLGSLGLPARGTSQAVSIGQRTASPGTPSGRSASLDKCPSLQEWFQHPARSGSSSGAQGSQPISGTPSRRGRQPDEESMGPPPPDLPSKASFGFGPTIHEAEENTSSDPEPETPRIDRPTAFHSPKRRLKETPFAANPSSNLSPMMEEAEEDNPELTIADAKPTANLPHIANPETGVLVQRSSLEMGAATLAQLRGVPMEGKDDDGNHETAFQSPPASLPGTPGTVDLNIPSLSSPTSPERSPGSRAFTPPPGALTAEDEALASGRPIRARHKSPTPKRSRSGRLVSPDKSQPRSKSPRLQRGFYVDTDATASGEQHIKLDEIRDAVHDIWSDM